MMSKPTYKELEKKVQEIEKTKKALKESEARLRSIIEHSNEMFFFHDTNHRLLYLSPQSQVIFDYAPDKARRKWTDFVTENPLNLTGIELTERAIRTGERQEPYLLELRKKDGGIVVLEIDESPVKDASGKVIAITGAARDVTRQKKAEQALQAEKERLRILVEKSPLGISRIGKDGRYNYLNPKFIEIFGYTLEDIPTGKEWFIKAYPDKNYRKEVIAAWFDDRKRYGIGEARLRTYQAACKDGSKKVISFRSVCMETGDQLVFYEDITETQRLEEQLRQAQKMEAIGTLAGGIAHDFNNLVQVIVGYAQMIMMGKEQGDPDLRRLREIETAGQRAGELTKQLLTFSRKVESKLRPVDLNREVRQVEQLLRRTIPKMITIELHLEEGLKVINADPAQVEQVMMNLSVNARDAMPEGGRLVIETETISLDEEYCKAHLGAVPGEYVLLAVSDTGSGMAKETVEHIFEPFYTTKEADKGTGLGLSMVYGIVKSHGGYIMCYSAPGEGTTFKIYFPAIEAVSMERGAEKEEQGEIQGGSETILLVDDERLLQDLGKEILERFGYTVLIADRGERALQIYREKSDEISLVILDIIMPGMGGKRCLEELLRINPLVKVVFTSGYSTNGPMQEAAHAGAKGFISKPYELRQMLEVVREVLDRE
jgi:two-component system cell cycle sensor histidine kinase/response regulator CckA